jgi:hypothetical protein
MAPPTQSQDDVPSSQDFNQEMNDADSKSKRALVVHCLRGKAKLKGGSTKPSQLGPSLRVYPANNRISSSADRFFQSINNAVRDEDSFSEYANQLPDKFTYSSNATYINGGGCVSEQKAFSISKMFLY